MENQSFKIKTIKPNEIASMKVNSNFYSLIVENYFSFCKEIGENTLIECSNIIKNNSYENVEESLLKKVKTLYMYLDLIKGIEEAFEKDNKTVEKEYKKSDFRSE